MRAPESRATRGGFTLLEVVLALGVLMLGLSAVLGLFSFGAGLARSSDLRLSAAQAAEAVIADLEEQLFPLGPDGEPGEPVLIEARALPNAPDLVYSARAQREPAAEHPRGRPPLYRVDVELAWSSAGARRTERFSALIARELPFGARMRRERAR